MQLRNFDAADFLAKHWQKKPLFIKNPWTEWRNPIAADELAGLSCEEGVEARLIAEKPNKQGSKWSLEHGPFDETFFSQLGNSHWTLLVQAVDQYVPQVSNLIAPFRFIPDWRIDDVMVSYAAENGGVGPHFDHYDVFLIQGAGTRKWQVGGMCNDDSLMANHEALRQLAEFEAEQEWVCEPGDILYIPPGISHNGVAIGDDCMTYSIGFRAPSRSDLISNFCDAIIDDMQENDRYADPDLALQENAGEIGADAISTMHAMVLEHIADKQAFRKWIGQYSTQPKYPENDYGQILANAETVQTHIANGLAFYRNPASRFAFIVQGDDHVSLFVDGQCVECHGPAAKLAQQLCNDKLSIINPQSVASKHAINLLLPLVDQGSLLLNAPE